MNIGGAEKLLTHLAPMINEFGHRCDVALFDGGHTPFKQCLLDAGVHVIDFAQGGSLYNPRHIFRLRRLMKKYDIVHTHNTAPQLFAAIGSLLCSVVLCTTEHTTSNRRRDWRWYKPIDKWMYSRYKAVISISPATTKNLLAHTKIKSQVYTIPNGIDVSCYAKAKPLARTALGLKPASKVVAMVAGFRYQKDQDTVIRAVASLPDSYELLLVGDGERRKECELLAKELCVGDRVHFLGTRVDVARILKTVDIVVMSSHYEGFGIAAVEGMSVGKPVVATNVPGLAEVVKDAGLLFAHQDVMGLKAIIERLVDDKSFCSDIIAKCKERAVQYDISKMRDSYLAVYGQILK